MMPRSHCSSDRLEGGLETAPPTPTAGLPTLVFRAGSSPVLEALQCAGGGGFAMGLSSSMSLTLGIFLISMRAIFHAR